MLRRDPHYNSLEVTSVSGAGGADGAPSSAGGAPPSAVAAVLAAVEEAEDGSLWVALKGPYYVGLYAMAAAANPLLAARARESVAQARQEREALAAVSGVPYGGHVMSGYAVWHVHPDRFDAARPAHGGVLYETQAAPVMSALDGDGNSFHAIDASPIVLRVSHEGDATELPLPADFAMSGPGVVATPDGSVWVCSLLHPNGTLLRFAPGATVPTRFEGFAPSGGVRRARTS